MQVRRCFPQLGEDWFNEGKTRRQKAQEELKRRENPSNGVFLY